MLPLGKAVRFYISKTQGVGPNWSKPAKQANVTSINYFFESVSALVLLMQA